MTENFWDQRFSEQGFAYGEEPNAYLSRRLGDLKPGDLILPAEGDASVVRLLVGRPN